MHAMLKATDRCNMDCTYCYVSKEQRRANTRLPTERMPALFRQIFEWQQSEASSGDLAFNWSGGEVLTLPKDYWEEVFRIQNRLYRDGRFTFKWHNGIQTNLTLLSDEYFELLQRNDVGIGTTIDGPKSCMDKTRRFWDGSSAFDVVMSRLRSLIDAKHMKPGVIVVLNRHNIDHIDELYRMFRDLGLGFQVNSYHYAPQSGDHDPGNAITSQEYIEAMCHLFDMWSKDTEEVHIKNFERALKFLQHGRVDLCSKTRNCAEYFYMVRWNGDVYPCNEYGGQDFEARYCYGNLLDDGWRSVREHPSRQALLSRRDTLRATPRKQGGCKGCRYWDGCHGGCLHSAMKFEYRRGRDWSAQRIAGLRDIPNCETTISLYGYIEKQLRKSGRANRVPVSLHLDRVSTNSRVRRQSFYRFHQDRWRAAMEVEDGSGPNELSEMEVEHLLSAVGGASNALHVCCGAGLLFGSRDRRGVRKWTGVDYRAVGEKAPDGLSGQVQIQRCDDIMEWEGWRSSTRWDVILVNPCLVHQEDVPGLLSLAAGRLGEKGRMLVYSRTSQLREKEMVEVTDYKGIRDYDKAAVSINTPTLSIAAIRRVGQEKGGPCKRPWADGRN